MSMGEQLLKSLQQGARVTRQASQEPFLWRISLAHGISSAHHPTQLQQQQQQQNSPVVTLNDLFCSWIAKQGNRFQSMSGYVRTQQSREL